MENYGKLWKTMVTMENYGKLWVEVELNLIEADWTTGMMCSPWRNTGLPPGNLRVCYGIDGPFSFMIYLLFQWGYPFQIQLIFPWKKELINLSRSLSKNIWDVWDLLI